MSIITQTLIEQRPNIETPFFSDTTYGRGDGELSLKTFVGTDLQRVAEHDLSEDELTKTTYITYPTLESVMGYQNQSGIAYNCNFFNYYRDLGADLRSMYDSIKFSGPDTPIRITTTYTFPADSAYQTEFVNTVTANNADPSAAHRTNFTQLDNTVTLTFEYANLAQFAERKFLEYLYFDDLLSNGVERTFNIEYI